MEDAGASIPTTVWIEEKEKAAVQEIMHAQGWESAIVKPTISASAHNLRRVFKDEPVVVLEGPAMIQQFIPEVVSSGEWSFVFIGGEYHHAVMKLPTPGDFRVQRQYGGRAARAEPTAEISHIVRNVVNTLPRAIIVYNTLYFVFFSWR